MIVLEKSKHDTTPQPASGAAAPPGLETLDAEALYNLEASVPSTMFTAHEREFLSR